MKRKNKKLPKFLQSALWSYNLDSFDLDDPNDKSIIIVQILNHGSWEQLQWLWRTYTALDIINVVQKPGRGVWSKEILDYWLKIFNLKIPRANYEDSIFTLTPKITVHVFKNTKPRKEKIAVGA